MADAVDLKSTVRKNVRVRVPSSALKGLKMRGKKPSFNRKEEQKDNRISVCTNCRAGIFKDHKYKWSTKGLIHIDCKDKLGVANALKTVS